MNEAGQDAFDELSYTVFGCGNTEWATTYQAVPTQLDAGLEQHGATRIHPRGAGDARGDFDAAYRNWHDTLWKDIATALGVDAPHETDESQPRLSITVTNRQVTNPVIMSYHAQAAVVRDNNELLGANAGRSTRHLEVVLPSGVAYKAGDHLGVLPRNNISLIRRVMLHFGLDAGSYVTIIPNRGNHTHLPTDEPAATRHPGQLRRASGSGNPQRHRGDGQLHQRSGATVIAEGLVGTDDESQTRFRNEVLARGRSCSTCSRTTQPVTCRSRSSSTACHRCAPLLLHLLLTHGQPRHVQHHHRGVARPARSGGEFSRVCSSYLESNAPNSTVFAFVREPTIAFRPPDDPQPPMIMIGAGTGLAPFRGFLQERAAQRARRVPVATSLLFFGCRTSEDDYLYEDELSRYEADGVVKVDAVFSREGDSKRRYVQDAIIERADDVWDLIANKNANIYVCGNANTMAPGVRTALIQVFRMNSDASTDGNNWLAGLRAGRFLEDIWGG